MSDSATEGGDASVGRLGRDTLIYGVGFVLQRAASFIMLPIWTRYLTAADYGLAQLLQMSLDVASILLAAGLTAAVWRYYFKHEGDRERRAVPVAAWLMMVVFNAIGAVALIAGSDLIATRVLDVPEAGYLVVITAISFFLDPCLIVPVLLMQVQQRSVLYTVVSVTRLVLQLTLNIVFVVGMELGVYGIVLSTLITYCVLVVPVLVWFFRQTGFPLIGRVARELFWFSLPYRLTEAGTFTLTFVDRYFLQALHGLAAVGLYGLAYSFGFLLAYLGQVPFLMAWNPQRFRMVTAPRAVRDRFYNAGLLLFSCLVLTLAVGIALYAAPVLQVMSNPEYHPAADLVPLVLLAYVFQAWTQVLEFNIQVSERTQYVTRATWIAVAVILALYWLLIPRYGAWGAAIATAVAFAVRFHAFHIFARRLWPVDYVWGPSFRLLGYAAAVVVVAVMFRPVELWDQLAWSTGWTLVYFALLWRGGVLDAEARAALLTGGRRGWALLRRLAGRRAL